MRPKMANRPQARRSLGQNFLAHQGVCESIIRLSGFNCGDTVIELGPGLGALTRTLAPRVKRVMGIELDRRLIEYVEANEGFGRNVEIRNQDMLDVSYGGISRELGTRLRIIGNLPYNISSQILFKLVDERDFVDFAVLMFQKEVADRLLSVPGTKDYGVLPVIVGYCADISRLLNIPPGLFRPKPKVVSTVVKIRFRPPGLQALDFAFFSLLVKAAFGKRRKKLSNALKGLACIDEGLIYDALSACGIKESLRAEELAVDDFVCIANRLCETARVNVL